MTPAFPRLRLRILLGDTAMIGPGKAQLLALIRETGSISAAGRQIGMSYKRAWSLVQVMNADFAEPLVKKTRGGHAHGGAVLTAAGEQALTLYQAVLDQAATAGAAPLAALHAMVKDTPGQAGTDLAD